MYDRTILAYSRPSLVSFRTRSVVEEQKSAICVPQALNQGSSRYEMVG